jgi:hypothetical protein
MNGERTAALIATSYLAFPDLLIAAVMQFVQSDGRPTTGTPTQSAFSAHVWSYDEIEGAPEVEASRAPDAEA